VVATAPTVGDTEAQARGMALEPVSRTAPEAVAREAHGAHGWRGPRDEKRWERFMEARELGLSPAEIIRETGLPSTTVYRWAAHLKRAGSAQA
jgi:DNA invertase Pin-like site-specific DNA recombinase